MRRYFSVMAVGLAVLCFTAQAPGQTVVKTADTIGDAVSFPQGASGQDRFEIIVGSANGFRHSYVRFDLSAFSAELANPSLQLSGADVILTEQAARDGADFNGTQTATIDAFLYTQASGDWVVPDNGGTATLQPGVFGLSFSNRRTDQFNPDAFARDCSLGNPCSDPNGQDGNGRMRFSSVGGVSPVVNTNSGPAFGGTDQPDVKFGSTFTQYGNARVSNEPAGSTEHTFAMTTDGGLDGLDQETVTINLLENVTALQMTATLNEWITGVNAGIGLFSDNGSQIFFESADAVNDGDGTSFALDTYTGGEFNTTVTTESGNGAGGTLLQLTFGLAGNADGDGDIDLDDLTLIRQNFGTSVTPDTMGDVTGDGNVDSIDLRIWQDAYDYVLNNPLFVVNAVPEPTSMLLGVMAICGLGLRRAR